MNFHEKFVRNRTKQPLWPTFHENYVQNHTKRPEWPCFHDETAGRSRRSETVLEFSDHGEVHLKIINK